MKAQLVWDNLSGSYKFKMIDIARWDVKNLKEVVAAIKSAIPSGFRDYEEDTKTWFVDDRFFDLLKMICNNKDIFREAFIFERPPEQTNTTVFIPTEVDLKHFAEHTQASLETIKSLSYEDAVRLYRRTAMRLHPDRNPAGAEEMSKLNEVWSRLKEKNVFNRVAVEQGA